MDDAHPAIMAAALLEGALDVGLISDQVELGDGRVGLQRQPNTVDDDTTPLVASHHIHDDSHNQETLPLPIGWERENLRQYCSESCVVIRKSKERHPGPLLLRGEGMRFRACENYTPA